MITAHVHLSPMTRRDDALLRNLYQFYLYDFSEFMGWDVDRRGRFDESDLAGCWDDPRRYQYLIEIDRQVAGFVMIDHLIRSPLTERSDVILMREFFVLRAHRRRGVGRAAAWRAFDLFHGCWEVFQLQENVAAQAFWRNVIDAYTAGHYTEITCGEQTWRGVMQTFDNRG
ncbi:MAG: GNAT family N-acetyltransferase [Anaerolineae bacterium]|nr:GNAT family N-acetyltransferase [Thermoflexales bacterium]MDW8406756.1 GNAT family N-acetyltransferase [Anaerolineae bacterium]